MTLRLTEGQLYGGEIRLEQAFFLRPIPGSMITGKYSDSNLGVLIKQVSISRKQGVADFKPYAPSNNEPCAFIAQPVLDGAGKVETIVALQLSLETINQIMQQREGMGQRVLDPAHVIDRTRGAPGGEDREGGAAHADPRASPRGRRRRAPRTRRRWRAA